MMLRNVLILVAVGAVLVAIGWWLEREEPAAGQTPAAAAPAPAAVAVPPATPSVAEGLEPLRQHAPVMPSGHPEIGVASSGTVTPDPNAQYTHFQVGERNVRRMMAEGGVIWVGTSGGVIRYDTVSDQFRHFSTHMGLIANGVFHLSRWRGKIAIGTYGGGLSMLDEKTETFRHYNIPEGLADAFVYDMVETEDGDLWIATWSGANLVLDGDLDDPQKWQTFTVENTGNGLPNDWVYALSRGENGTVWFATEGGLARFRDGAWANWNHDDGLGADYDLVKDDIQFQNDPSQYSEHHSRQKVEMGLQQVDVAYNPNYIVALDVAKGDIVWAGTWGGGLARFDGENWTNYTTRDGLPSNHVFMLYRDQHDRLWIGTGKGLARMEDDGSFKVYGTAEGLFSEIVFSMQEANDGSYWIGSYGGVTHIRDLP
jgi:ligand-binding sensor domain-containing protein